MTLEVDVSIVRDGFRVEVAFGAADGETVALLGPNGAGKSTVAACLAGLLSPTGGRVELDGVAWDDPATQDRIAPEERRVGVVFQDALLLPHLSALENAAFPLRALGVAGRDARERATALLDRLGFPAARAGARPADLSGGEIQRVALARALVREPRLLVMDEPTSSLDVRARAEVRSLLRTVLSSFGGIRVLITHDPVEAMSLADRIVVLEDGRMTQRGTPDELRDAPRTGYVAELVGVNLFAGRLEPLEAGAARLQTPDGAVIVARPAHLKGVVEGVLGVVRPADVTLHLQRPEGGSARNVVVGTVEAIAFEGDRARVRIASKPPIVAEITRGSLDRLGLADGAEVWASFKAVEVDVRLPT